MRTLSILFTLLSAVTILNTSAAESFTCTREGVFPIPGSCREYYECFAWKDSLFLRPTRCRHGTFFDAEFSTCRPVSRNNPSPCTDNSHEVTTTVAPHVENLKNDRNPLITPDNAPSEDVNVTPQDTFGNRTLDFPSVPENGSAIQEDSIEHFGILNTTLSNGTESLNTTLSNGTESLNTTLNNGLTIDDTTTTTQAPVILTLCDHLNFVTTYATLIIGTPLYRQSLAYEKKFNKLAKRYNAILEDARNNSLVWQNGDSIIAGIKKTFQLTSQYEREFNRKYEIYKQQISKQTSNEGNIAKLREDIKKLQEDIKGSEQALSITTAPQVRVFLENNIKSKQQEIDRKQEEIASSSKAAQELGELLHFLEFVKDDGKEVEILAMHLQTRISTLSSQYTSDLVTLQRFINRVNESINSLANEAESIETYFADNTERQQALELQKGNLNDETSKLNAEHSENLKSIKNLHDKANRKQKKFREKMEKVCHPEGAIKLQLKRNPTEEEIQAACNKLLEAQNVRLDIANELDQVSKLLQENKRKRNRITEILAEIDNANRELTQLLDDVPRHETKLHEINTETKHLQLLHREVLALTSSASDAVDSLTVIDETVREVSSSSESFTKQFSILITQGHSAKTDEDRLQEKAAIEKEVSELLWKIHQLELQNLEICT